MRFGIGLDSQSSNCPIPPRIPLFKKAKLQNMVRLLLTELKEKVPRALYASRIKLAQWPLNLRF